MPAKITSVVLFSSLLWACNDNYFPEKEIQYKDVRVSWYWKALGDNRRDFVEVSKGSQHEIVMNCRGMMLTDISIVNDSIVIKMHELNERAIYASKDNAFGIPIRIDPWATQNEFNKIYNPKFYKPGEK